MERRNDVTKERIEKELQKVRQQLATLQERQKDLEEQLQMMLWHGVCGQAGSGTAP